MTGTALAPRGKKYFPEGFYSMHGDSQLMDMAESTSLPPVMRLYFLASARANRWGHAPFASREIEKLLGISDTTRRKAVNSLISSKVVAPSSTFLCLVLNAAAVRRGDRTYRTCIEPSHVECQRLMWAAGQGWESSEGELEKLVNDPGQARLVARRTTRKRRIVEEVETVEEVSAVPYSEQWPEVYELPKPWNPAEDDAA